MMCEVYEAYAYNKRALAEESWKAADIRSTFNAIYSIFIVRFPLTFIVYYLWWEKIYKAHVYKGLLLMNHWNLWKFVQWVIKQIQCHLFDLYCAIFFNIHCTLLVRPWCFLEESQCHLFDLYCTIFIDMHCLLLVR